MASTDLPRILLSGIDTLHLSSRVPLFQPHVEGLLKLKEAARNAGRNDPPLRVEIEGHSLAIKPHGARNASFLLDGEHMVLKLAPGAPRNLPPSTLELRALFLWQLGADAAAAVGRRVLGAVSAMKAADFPGPTMHVGRIDLTVDFQGWIPELADFDRFVTRAEDQAAYRKRSVGFTGFAFGRGDVVARLYDKTAEIRKSGKTWFGDLWAKSPTYVPDAPVWRLEFQLRRGALRNFTRRVGAGPLDTWEDVRGAVVPLWRYLSGRWFSLRAPRTSMTRQVLTPTWQVLHDEAFADGTWGGTSDSLYRIAREAHVGRTEALLAGVVAKRVAEHRYLTGDESDFGTCAARVTGFAVVRAAQGGRPLPERADELVTGWRDAERAASTAHVNRDVPVPGRRYDQDPEDGEEGTCGDTCGSQGTPVPPKATAQHALKLSGRAGTCTSTSRVTENDARAEHVLNTSGEARPGEEGTCGDTWGPRHVVVPQKAEQALTLPARAGTCMSTSRVAENDARAEDVQSTSDVEGVRIDASNDPMSSTCSDTYADVKEIAA